jgi:hypothetical protein
LYKKFNGDELLFIAIYIRTSFIWIHIMSSMIRPKNVGENMEIFEAFIYICGAKFKPHKLE